MKTINLIISFIKKTWPSFKYLLKAVAPIL